MKTYKVVIAQKAKDQMQAYLRYIKNELKNPQAAKSIRDDWKETKKTLSITAGSFAIADSPKLKAQKLRKIHFKKHQYVMLYRLNGDVAEVVKIYHDLQDYENY